MKKRLAQLGVLFLVLMLIVGCSLSPQSEFVSEEGQYSLPKEQIYGKWVVKNYINPSGKISMSEKRAKKLIDLELMFNSDVAKTIEVVDFDNGSRIYNNPSYQYKVEEDADRYLFDFYGITTDKLPVELNELHAIDIYHENTLRAEVIYLKKSNRLMMVWNGYWYFAERPPWYSRLYSWCLSWF